MKRSPVHLLCWFLCVLAACSGDDKRKLTVGTEPNVSGTAGRPAGASGQSSAGASGKSNTATGSDNALGVRVQDVRDMTIDVITLSCAGDCADIEAVAHGGNPPYAVAWEDGSTDPKRHVCLDESATLRVSATDTAISDDEFSYDARTVTADVSATVLDCSDAGVPVDATGHVFVANRGGNTILELDAQLNLVDTRFADQGLSGPEGLAIGPDGAIWIADSGNNRIVSFDTQGALRTTIPTIDSYGFYIESVYLDAQGTLYASGLSGPIARYKSDGSVLPDALAGATFGPLGGAKLTFNLHVLVSDYGGVGNGVREYDRESDAVLRTFGTDLGFQEDVVVDGADRVFVTHFDGDEIVVFDAQRAELMRFSTPASEAVPLVNPSGIALTSDCRIVVAGFGSNRIYEWRHHGTEPPEYVRSLAFDGLTLPESIAVAGLALPGTPPSDGSALPSCD